MRKQLFDQSVTVEDRYTLGQLYMEKIRMEMAQEDLKVLLENADAITKQRGGSGNRERWPYKYDLEGNIKDLAWLELCTKYRQLASYVIRDDQDRYVGCVYVYPIELHYADKASEYDVDFSFWITQRDYDTGLYEIIYRDLLNWLSASLGFDLSRVFLRNIETPHSLRRS